MKSNIKEVIKRSGKNQKEIAALLGKSSENFTQQLNRDNFRLNDLEKIAKICGYELEIKYSKHEELFAKTIVV